VGVGIIADGEGLSGASGGVLVGTGVITETGDAVAVGVKKAAVGEAFLVPLVTAVLSAAEVAVAVSGDGELETEEEVGVKDTITGVGVGTGDVA
jgi:hypothetical protein